VSVLNEYLQTGIELLVGFAALFAFTKLLGKAHFSQLTPFDFISALILGELLGNAVYDKEVDIWRILFSTAFWGLLIWSIGLITQKWARWRKPLEGEPSVVIRKGKLEYEALKRNGLDLNQLQTLLRQKGIFSMSQVDYAILETNGMMSVLSKFKDDVPTRNDLGLPEKPNALPVALILDGQLIKDNLSEAGVDEAWLKKQLNGHHLHRYEDVFFAEWNDNDLYVAPYK
jgi:uncharacterized membrane protein YcaP (DUF421 family)